MIPHYETYRYTDELCKLKAQSIVECRLPGSEITAVLAVQAVAVPTECACADGETRYGGKLVLSILYEDAERKICRAERGAEFFHKAEHVSISPACFAKARLNADNITVRREGSGLYIAVIVGAEICVYETAKTEYLTGGEGLITRKNNLTVARLSCAFGETEREDEFDADYVGDILLHSENLIVTNARAGAGQIDIDGEMSLNVCALKSDGTLCAYERLIPFAIRIPSEEAFGNVSVNANVYMRSANLTAGVDEEKGRSKIVLTTTIAADCVLQVKDELLAVDDAFSKTCEVTLKKEKQRGRYLTNIDKYVERISGAAAMSDEMDENGTLTAAVCPRVEVACKKTERGGYEVEGVVQADVIFQTADGAHKKSVLSLPVAFPIECDGDYVEAEAIVYGLNVRRRKSGETEAEGALKVVVKTYEEFSSEYVSEAEEGAAYEENDCGVSIFLPKAGEDLWQVSKRLKRAPEELEKSNPDMKFPVEKGERILVYRKIGENL